LLGKWETRNWKKLYLLTSKACLITSFKASCTQRPCRIVSYAMRRLISERNLFEALAVCPCPVSSTAYFL